MRNVNCSTQQLSFQPKNSNISFKVAVNMYNLQAEYPPKLKKNFSHLEILPLKYCKVPAFCAHFIYLCVYVSRCVGVSNKENLIALMN